ncbi:MAG: DegT/DnrJ/EryC1/StrS family aminotransferase [Anaerolineae bacterium]|nr:DegT/DnrJ/EryC1/StrS family aminotransferase [Anaerolineae bacterium]
MRRAELDSIALLERLSGRGHARLTGRAATGIWAALKALGAEGRPVLIPANTCYIVLWATLEAGCSPRLVEVDPTSGCMSLETIHRFEEDLPAAIIPCHLYGNPAPVSAISRWARARGIAVIEDAALALGGMADGRPAGGWGDVSVYSFGLGKIVDVELGGAVLTDDPALDAEIGRLLEDTPLWNARLSEITQQWHDLYWALHQYEQDNLALVDLYPTLHRIYSGLVRYQLPASYWDDLPAALRALPGNLAHRAEIAATYAEALANAPLQRPILPEGSVAWRYTVRARPVTRNSLLRHLWENGQHGVTRWYPWLEPMASAIAPAAATSPSPNAEAWCASVLNLPLDSSVTVNGAHHTASLITRYFEAISG